MPLLLIWFLYKKAFIFCLFCYENTTVRVVHGWISLSRWECHLWPYLINVPSFGILYRKKPARFPRGIRAPLASYVSSILPIAYDYCHLGPLAQALENIELDKYWHIRRLMGAIFKGFHWHFCVLQPLFLYGWYYVILSQLNAFSSNLPIPFFLCGPAASH